MVSFKRPFLERKESPFSAGRFWLCADGQGRGGEPAPSLLGALPARWQQQLHNLDPAPPPPPPVCGWRGRPPLSGSRPGGDARCDPVAGTVLPGLLPLSPGPLCTPPPAPSLAPPQPRLPSENPASGTVARSGAERGGRPPAGWL